MHILYALLAVLAAFAGFGAVIALITSVVSSIKPRYVYVAGVSQRVHVSDEKRKDGVAKALEKRWFLALKAGLVFLGCTLYLAVYFFGGILDATNEDSHKSAVASARELAESSLINPPTSDEDLLALKNGDLATDVVLPDGSTVKAAITPGRRGFFERYSGYWKPADEASEETLAPILDENGQFDLDAAQQRQWLVYGEVYGDLEDTYGVFLDDAQRAALAVPLEEPAHLTRYGNAPLTTSLGDGTYFNGTVTLIWDGEYKLIGSEGTDQAAELTRK